MYGSFKKFPRHIWEKNPEQLQISKFQKAHSTILHFFKAKITKIEFSELMAKVTLCQPRGKWHMTNKPC